MMFAALALAAAVTASKPPPFPRYKRKVRTSARWVHADSMTRLALRRELLHDFLVETRTETAAFVDARIVHVAGSIDVGPATVDVDFIGSPIVRARVRNVSRQRVDVLLSATLRDKRGRHVSATTRVGPLEAGASRAIELLSPASLVPASVEWTATPL